MDICERHNDYITNVRKSGSCRKACCNKNTLEYCDSFKHGFPEVIVAIVPDDITIMNKKIQRGESYYKTLEEYTDEYNITAEQVNKILQRKMRRDVRFFKKIEIVKKMMKNKDYSAIENQSSIRTINKLYSWFKSKKAIV